MKTSRRRMWLALGFAGALFGVALQRRRTSYLRALSHRPATAFVTGASSGIGAEFARQLAAKGYDLVLVARRAERLQTLATELEQRYSVIAQPLAADLADPADVERVAGRIRASNDLAVLVNNAGFGIPGSFSRGNLDRQIDMIHVHVIATVRLTHAALPGMLERRRGAIVNVSSVAAFTPVAVHPTYTATKAYLNNFSESLAAELRGRGVHIQALCPGFVHTEMHATPEESAARARIPSWLWLPVRDLVADSLAALGRGEVVYIPDARYKSVALLGRFGLVSLGWKLLGKFYRPQTGT